MLNVEPNVIAPELLIVIDSFANLASFGELGSFVVAVDSSAAVVDWASFIAINSFVITTD